MFDCGDQARRGSPSHASPTRLAEEVVRVLLRRVDGHRALLRRLLQSGLPILL